MSKYYEIERVADKVMDDKIMHSCLYKMAGAMRTPDLIALKKISKSNSPIVYYCHIDDIEDSPLQSRLDHAMTAYSYCPQDKSVLESLKKIGVSRIVLYSQFFKTAPSPKSLEFDPNMWYLMYGDFRDACRELGIELHVTRLAIGGRFICPIHEENSYATVFLTSAMKYIPFEKMLSTEYQFPDQLDEEHNRWAVTSEEFIFDHIRKEEVQLLSDKDGKHVYGYTEIQGVRYIVGTTLKVEARGGPSSWDALKYRRLVIEREERRNKKQKSLF